MGGGVDAAQPFGQREGALGLAPVGEEPAGLPAQLLLVGAQDHTALAACRLSAASTTVWFPPDRSLQGKRLPSWVRGRALRLSEHGSWCHHPRLRQRRRRRWLVCQPLLHPLTALPDGTLNHVQECHGRGHRFETCRAHPTKPQVNGLAPGRLRRSETHHGPTGPGRGHSSSPSGRS
jgi:hypothetical protein